MTQQLPLWWICEVPGCNTPINTNRRKECHKCGALLEDMPGARAHFSNTPNGKLDQMALIMAVLRAAPRPATPVAANRPAEVAGVIPAEDPQEVEMVELLRNRRKAATTVRQQTTLELFPRKTRPPRALEAPVEQGPSKRRQTVQTFFR